MEPSIWLQRQHRSSSRPTEQIDADWLFALSEKAVTSAKSERQDRLERRAALLAWLDPTLIAEPNQPVTIDDGDLAAILAAGEIVPTPQGPRRRLLFDVRRAALKRMGTRAAMQDVMAAMSVPTEDPIQRMLVRLVRGDRLPIAQLDRSELAATLVVIDWLDGILDGLPDPAKVRARLAREDLCAPLRHLSKNFIGREPELDQLRGYLGDVSQSSTFRQGKRAIRNIAASVASTFTGAQTTPPLFIHGIGGVGKSTLVAKFGLELAEQEIPFVFLDLDRPHLDPRRPTTLLAEAARQLRDQLPAAAAQAQKVAEDLDAKNRNLGGAQEADGYVDVSGSVDEFCKFVRKHTSRNLPFIVDTFEVAQSLGDVPVYLTRELIDQLQTRIANLRPVICGRVLPDQARFATEALPLLEFDAPSAERFLFGLLNGKSGDIDQATIATAVRSVERTPLALTLTSQLLVDHGIDAVRSPSIFGIVLYTKDAAYLYNRVLDHIPPGPMQKLAKPGLVLRRLSPEIIREVLATICDLEVRSDEDARRLFEEFSLQVSLVEREPRDMLRHRSDVRRLMLPALEREVGRTTVRTIDEAAVRFHSKFDDPIFRAEELYHRLRLSDLEGFEVRWRDDVADRLRESIEDFEPQRGWAGLPEARVALSLKLGLTPDKAALEVADLAHWERATAERAALLLQQGQFETALKILQERQRRIAGSQLFRQQAEAFMGLSRFEDALATAQTGVNSAREVGDTETVFENAHVAARAAEAMGDKEGAVNWLNQATEAAVRLGQAEKLLRAALLRSRMEGWITTAIGQALPTLLPIAQSLLKLNVAGSAASAPILRALAAATAGDVPISRAVLRRLGIERLSPALMAGLAALIAKIAAGDSLSSRSVRAVLASANEQIPPSDANAEAWSRWIAGTSGPALGNALAELSKESDEYGVTADVVDWTSQYFKEVAAAPEVQQAAAQAAASA